MKCIYTLSLLFLFKINFHFSQSAFDRGFDAGYEKANPIGVPPIVLPPIGRDTYADGYGIGYARGLADYNASNNTYSVPSGSFYEPNTQEQQQNFIPEYKSISPDFDKMGEMLREKQKQHDSRYKHSRNYYRPKTVTKTYYRPKASPNWNSSSYINRSFCSVSFKSNNNTILFSTNDKNTYQVWQNGKMLGTVTKRNKLEFYNITRGTYQFQVYNCNRRRKKRLRFSQTWSLSTSKSRYIIDITNNRMDFKY